MSTKMLQISNQSTALHHIYFCTQLACAMKSFSACMPPLATKHHAVFSCSVLRNRAHELFNFMFNHGLQDIVGRWRHWDGEKRLSNTHELIQVDDIGIWSNKTNLHSSSLVFWSQVLPKSHWLRPKTIIWGCGCFIKTFLHQQYSSQKGVLKYDKMIYTAIPENSIFHMHQNFVHSVQINFRF